MYAMCIQNSCRSEEGVGSLELKAVVSHFVGAGVLIRVIITVIKHHDQKQDREERVYFTHSSIW